MTRAQFRDTVMVRGPTGMVGIAPITAAASLCDVGTLNLIGESIYADESGTELLPNPVPVSVNGSLDFWLAAERELDLVVACPGYIETRITVTADAAYVPGSNPFPEYLTQAEGDALVSTHATAVDPHPTYLTQAEGDARYLQIGSSPVGVDSELRTYIRTIMAILDPSGPPPPPP